MMTEIDALKIAAGQEVAVDLMRPADAPGVAALFRAVYGQKYPVETYYQPQELVAANQDGRIISSVARTPKGDIVGHNAMYRIAPCPKVYEGGAGLVLPAYRNTAKLLTRMIAMGLQAVPEFGGEGVFGEAVCNHLHTQKAAVTLGNIPMGLEVELMPAEVYQAEKSAPGRVSSLAGFQTIKPYPHAVHLPQAYEDALRFLYEGLAEPRQMETSTQAPPAERRSRLAAEIYDYAQVTRITAWETGWDLIAALEPLEIEAAAQGVAVFQIWLPLSSPWVGWAADVLRGRGYFLGGLLPRWFDEDGLLMQRLRHVPDWNAIQLLSERSQEIARLVRRDWEAARSVRMS